MTGWVKFLHDYAPEHLFAVWNFEPELDLYNRQSPNRGAKPAVQACQLRGRTVANL